MPHEPITRCRGLGSNRTICSVLGSSIDASEREPWNFKGVASPHAGSFNDQVHSIGPTLFFNPGGNDNQGEKNEAKAGEDQKAAGPPNGTRLERWCPVWTDGCHIRHGAEIPSLYRVLSALDQSPSIQVEATNGVPATSVSLALVSTTLKSGSIGWKAISDALGLVGFIWSERHWQRPTLRDDTATKRGNDQNDPEPLHRCLSHLSNVAVSIVYLR